MMGSEKLRLFIMIVCAILFTILFAWTHTASGSRMTLKWQAPEKNADGTELTDLDKFRVYCRVPPAAYDKVHTETKDLQLIVSGFEVNKLECLTVSAVDTSGNEGVKSAEICVQPMVTDPWENKIQMFWLFRPGQETKLIYGSEFELLGNRR